jgi:UDP-N-acetylglucosamine 2-epimerase (non-hydrolysing)
MHRPSNVDHPETLNLIVEALVELSERAQVIFPVHPRTRKRIEDLAIAVSGRVHLVEPLGYLDFLALQYRSQLVITDSGGIQEETTALNVPCITVRENTERPITIEEGTNCLVDIDKNEILRTAQTILCGKAVKGKCPALWDGKAAERIVQFLNKTLI